MAKKMDLTPKIQEALTQLMRTARAAQIGLQYKTPEEAIVFALQYTDACIGEHVAPAGDELDEVDLDPDDTPDVPLEHHAWIDDPRRTV